MNKPKALEAQSVSASKQISLVFSLKAKQSAKIAELRQALLKAGVQSLDEQAVALNLSRSTAWTVLKGDYKASGLSAKIVKRMLASPNIPPGARTKIREYVEEKLAGSFGHSEIHTRRFKMRIVERE
jgi:hypothetical protein